MKKKSPNRRAKNRQRAGPGHDKNGNENETGSDRQRVRPDTERSKPGRARSLEQTGCADDGGEGPRDRALAVTAWTCRVAAPIRQRPMWPAVDVDTLILNIQISWQVFALGEYIPKLFKSYFRHKFLDFFFVFSLR